MTIDAATLALCNQVVLKVCSHLSSQPLSMLIEHFPRDEREVVQLVTMIIVALSVLFHLIIELFLVVEEEELVLEDVRAAHLHGLLVLHILLDAIQCFTLLLELQLLL